MDSTYKFLAGLAQSMGLIYFMAMFFAVLAYAMWPGNKKSFDEASQIPLKED